MWVYRRVKDGSNWLYTVGYFYNLEGFGNSWEPIEDFTDEQHARQLVNYLNGGGGYLPSCQP